MASGAAMLAEVAAPPAVGAALAGLVVLAGVLGMAVGYGLYFAWKYTLGWVLNRIAALIDVSIVGRHPLRGASRAIVSASNAVQGAFLRIASEGERGFALGVDWLGWLWSWTVHEFTATSATTAGLFARLFDRDLPQVRSDATKAATTTATAKAAPVNRAQSAAIAATAAHVGVLERTWAGRLADLERGIDRVETKELPRVRRTIVELGARVGTLGKSIGGLRTRVRGVEKLLGLAAFAALVARAIGRLGLRWLRCGNVTKTGKRVCGMDPGLLDALLAGSLLVAGAFSIREMARDLREPTRLVADGLHTLIREVDKLDG